MPKQGQSAKQGRKRAFSCIGRGSEGRVYRTEKTPWGDVVKVSGTAKGKEKLLALEGKTEFYASRIGKELFPEELTKINLARLKPSKGGEGARRRERWFWFAEPNKELERIQEIMRNKKTKQKNSQELEELKKRQEYMVRQTKSIEFMRSKLAKAGMSLDAFPLNFAIKGGKAVYVDRIGVQNLGKLRKFVKQSGLEPGKKRRILNWAKRHEELVNEWLAEYKKLA